MLYIRWERGEREDMAAFLYVDNRTFSRIHLNMFAYSIGQSTSYCINIRRSIVRNWVADG